MMAISTQKVLVGVACTAGTAAFYVGAKAVYKGYELTIQDWLSHHPGEYSKTLKGIEIIIKEQATKWNAHKIKLTITWSPDDKVTGKSAEHHTWHASSSREACLKDLEKIVEKAYLQTIK